MARDPQPTREHSSDPGVFRIEDSDLLRRYANSGSNEAFAELVRRRIGLVYSVALRQAGGDRHRAEDATQAVFTDLARKAASLAERPVLAGWLYRSAQFAAAGLVRADQRRQAREQEAHTMEKIFTEDEPQPDWDRVRPMLDQALNEIDERDRDAILLRFFDERPFADIGARLRLTENAARMRVERALDKLNVALARRGITSTTAAVAAALGQQGSVAMPAGFASTVTGAALAGTTASGGWLAAFMSMSKLQLGILSAVAVTGATGYALQARHHAELRREIAALRATQQSVAQLRAENQQLARTAAEVELLRRDDDEFKQLGQKIADTQKARLEADRLAHAQAMARSNEKNFQAELDRLNREGNALVEQYKSLSVRAKNLALSADVRAEAETAAKSKLEEIKAKQREVKALIASSPETALPRAQLRSLESAQPRTPSDAPGTWAFRPGEGEPVSVKLPDADVATALATLRAFGVKIVPDASIANVQGVVNVITAPSSKPEAIDAVRAALRDQLNVVLEPTADGSFVAKLGAPR